MYAVSHPIGAASLSRKKNRISYSHEEFKIDLTQVTLSTSPNSPVRLLIPLILHSSLIPLPQPQFLHELEIEIARSELVLSTAMMRNDQTLSEHERSAFDELIRAFVNNARILVKNANEGWG